MKFFFFNKAQTLTILILIRAKNQDNRWSSKNYNASSFPARSTSKSCEVDLFFFAKTTDSVSNRNWFFTRTKVRAVLLIRRESGVFFILLISIIQCFSMFRRLLPMKQQFEE